MSRGKPYPAETRQRALDLYAEHGAAHAGRETGISPDTIRVWASRAGLSKQRAEKTAAASAAHRRSATERRARLADRLLEIAERATDRELELLINNMDLRDVVGARTRAIHDHQLLAGEATSRAENRTTDRLDREIEEMLDQMRGRT